MDPPYEISQPLTDHPALFSDKDHVPTLRRKRSAVAQPRRRQFSLIVASHQDHHKATELCESDRSRGPSFISFSEQRFCDMESKIHYPFCGDGQDHECFDGKTLSVISMKRSTAKPYSGVVTWKREHCPPNYPTCDMECPLDWHVCITDYQNDGLDKPWPMNPLPKVWHPPKVITPPEGTVDIPK